jgi:ferrochelatase
MRLENILALTNAKLINEPFVNSFEDIVFQPSKVKRGDLFVAFEEEEIQTAILNGAYGIMFGKPTQISDNEIAWIKVLDIEDALKRLLRFRVVEKELVVYECNEIILKLALQVITEPSFIVLNGDIKSISKTLWHVENKSVILFCPALCDKDIFANVKKLPKTAMEPITIMEQTLFETSFIYNDKFYERQLISPFFMPYLEELLHLFKTLNINYRLKKFTPINHFEALFVNKKFEEKEFGKSDKVLIFEPNVSLIEFEIKFLQKSASWANLIYIIPHAIDDFQGNNVFVYENPNKIVNILKNNFFHFALIVGVDKSILSKPITNQAQLTLDL